MAKKHILVLGLKTIDFTAVEGTSKYNLSSTFLVSVNFSLEALSLPFSITIPKSL